MRILNIVVLTLCQGFCLHLFSQSGRADVHEVKIASSTIVIHGETNVNKFKCAMKKPVLEDYIVVKNVWSNQKLDFEGLKLAYKIADFECSVQAMNPDFQELLKAEEEPHLYLELNSITLNSGNNAFEKLTVMAEMEIYLAGVKRKVRVSDGIVINHSDAHMTLKGTKKMLMTDFDIDPPTKFLGMVKVDNDIKIEFEIVMKVSPL